MKQAPYYSTSERPGHALEINKPVAEVQRIIERLLLAAMPVAMQQGGGTVNLQTLSSKETGLMVILLLKGQINFIRTTSGGILFGAANAPAVLGLQGSTFRKDVFKYVAASNTEICILPRETAITLIKEHGLIHEVLDYHAYISDMEVSYSNRLINKTTYEMVCTLLTELATLPEPVRLKTSVAQYILERSKMGRSGMMRILADLRKGEYIYIRNGKLIKILKNLPKVY